MTKLSELLGEIRNHYVERFAEAINDYDADEETSLMHECAYRYADGEVISNGELQLPLRGDMFVVSDGEVTDSLSFDTEQMLSFSPVTSEWTPELSLIIHPFQWNSLQLRLYGLPQSNDWEPLRAWFLQWFHDEDPDGDELLGGVHFMSDPEAFDTYFEFSLDLGTAPVECVDELFDALIPLGATKAEIGLFTEDAD